MNEQQTSPEWERKIIENLASEGLKEQRRRRQWGIFFKFLGAIYFAVLLALMFSGRGGDGFVDGAAHTAVIEIEGVIAANTQASAEKVNGALRDAFKNSGVKGVILKINSPGGSPVQAGMIYDEMQRLKKQKPNVKVYAVVEDLCASGGYYIASGADFIYVDKASLVGSIGVIMDGFGFTEAMKHVGIERRAYTAGDNKALLDPFSPSVPAQVDYIKGMLHDIHVQFITAVKQGRGKRLKETPDMFSGLFWTGERSVELGLTDGFGTVRSVAREQIHAETLHDYTEREPAFERFARRMGGVTADGFMNRLMETRYR